MNSYAPHTSSVSSQNEWWAGHPYDMRTTRASPARGANSSDKIAECSSVDMVKRCLVRHGS